jgi:hypothetical protein
VTISVRPVAGWKRDRPDARDWLMAAPAPKIALPSSAMLDWSGVPIRDQGNRNSCVGWSGERKVRYLDWLFDREPIDYSPLFGYDMARIEGGILLEQDEGAYIRDFYKGLRKWGIPPETMWHADEHGTEEPPPPVVYEAAEKHQAIYFYRCPSLRTIRAAISHGFPVQAGFDCPADIFSYATQGTGEIYYPEDESRFDGGHAIVLVGYDDTKRVGSDLGAFRIANSWGATWGDHGFGWLGYRFFERGHATDAWSLRSVEL